MVYKLYNKYNLNIVYIALLKGGNPKDPKIYNKKFPKLFIPKTTTNKDKYLFIYLFIYSYFTSICGLI